MAGQVGRYCGGAITPEMEPELRKFWYDDKLTTTVIGVRLGVTKNVVVSAVRRMGLTPRRKGSAGRIFLDGVGSARKIGPPHRSRDRLKMIMSAEISVLRDGWTPAADDALRTMWDGETLAAIGRKLYTSKNSVQSRALRLGLCMRRQPTAAEVAVRRGAAECQWTDCVRRPWKFCCEPVALNPHTHLPTAWCPTHYRRVYTHRSGGGG